MKSPRTIALIFLVLAVFGFVDATYLTALHYIQTIPPCFVASGCEKVLTSDWSVIAGLPVSLFGTLYYLLVIALALGYLTTGKKLALKLAAAATMLGFAFTLFLTGIQLFDLKEWCFYCLISAVISTGLFAAGLMVLFRNEEKNALSDVSPTSSDQPQV